MGTYTMSKIVMVVLAFVSAQHAASVTWIKGSGGASCETVCAARDGCDNSAWPTTEEEFTQVAGEAGQVCESTQAGGARYDPSTDGHHCGWEGSDSDEEGDRCAATGDSGTYRFCPCNADKEL